MHWLKLWTRGWLEGSIRFDLTPAQRSVFLDLCALARESRNPPMVQANETTAYPHSWLASKLNIPLELLEETLRICIEQKRISENTTGIKVLKFQYYQSRQEKPSGERKPSQKKRGESSPLERAEADRRLKIAMAYREKQKELGRDLTAKERQEIVDKVDEEIEKQK